MNRIRGTHYRSGQAIEIACDRGRITEIQLIEPAADLPILAPGLFDLQINGYGGIWFSDESLTVEQCLTTLHAHYQYGITHLFPTLITNSHEALAQIRL